LVLFSQHKVLVGEVLLGLLCQSHPRLGHVDQQDPATCGNRLLCDSKALYGVTPILIRCHEFAPSVEGLGTHIVLKGSGQIMTLANLN
jgi:hypothetical protein